jgi:hypothetical protein
MLRKFPQILQYALPRKKGLFLVPITPEVISVLDYRKGFGHPTSSHFDGSSQIFEFPRFAGWGGAAWRPGREPAAIPASRVLMTD